MEIPLLPTAAVADASLRVGARLQVAEGLRPAWPGAALAGRACPVVHSGSVDVFLHAIGACDPGDVLVIADGGRTDRGCLGDLVALEAQSSGLGGAVIWGAHRDTAELARMAFPVFSRRANPAGPRRAPTGTLDLPDAVELGHLLVDRGDGVFADADGVVIVPKTDLEAVVGAATQIQETERHQAERMRSGASLRQQVGFDAYLERRRVDVTYTFRTHLRSVGGEIEE